MLKIYLIEVFYVPRYRDKFRKRMVTLNHFPPLCFVFKLQVIYQCSLWIGQIMTFFKNWKLNNPIELGEKTTGNSKTI